MLDKEKLEKPDHLQIADNWQTHPANGFGP